MLSVFSSGCMPQAAVISVEYQATSFGSSEEVSQSSELWDSESICFNLTDLRNKLSLCVFVPLPPHFHYFSLMILSLLIFCSIMIFIILPLLIFSIFFKFLIQSVPSLFLTILPKSSSENCRIMVYLLHFLLAFVYFFLLMIFQRSLQRARSQTADL